MDKLFSCIFSLILVLLTSTKFSYAAKANPCLALEYDPLKCVEIPCCGFCIQQDFCHRRCNYDEKLKAKNCSHDNILDEIVLNTTVSSGAGSTPVLLPLVSGTPINLTVTFDLTKIPLILYFLVDFTGSMRDDVDFIIFYADKLVQDIHNFSPGSKLGFGTFTDKATPPFGTPDRRYSFRHNLDFTSTATLQNLSGIIAAVPLRSGGGVDLPDAQLDAMSEVAVCGDKIGGWPAAAHKVIFMVTDGPYHVAGDGEAGNITKPFDGQCHLDANKTYTGESLDYPSVDQLTQIITTKEMGLILMVLPTDEESYQNLTKGLPNSVVTSPNDVNKTLSQFFLEGYASLRNRFRLEQSGNISPAIKIKYFSTCGGDIVQEGKICETLNNSTSVTFTIQVELIKCPENEAEWRQTLKINPFGFSFLFQDIKLALQCEPLSCDD